MQHSIVAPSSAGYTVLCTGRILAQLGLPELNTDEDSQEGTASHWASASSLLSYLPDSNGIKTARQLVGARADNGLIVTDEMADAAEVYVSEVLRVCNAVGGLTRLHVEETLDISTLHPACTGTPDAWLYCPRTQTVYVFDYKYGRRYVAAFECWQLICYTAGVFQLLGINGAIDQHITVKHCVVQPRNYHKAGPIRWHTYNGAELRAHFNVLRNKFAEALGPNATCTPGPVQCRDCNARGGACRAIADATDWLSDFAKRPERLGMSGDDIGVEIGFLEEAVSLLKYRLDALKVEGEVILRDGGTVAGHHMARVSGALSWVKPEEEVLALGAFLGEEFTQSKLRTPTQVMDTLKRANKPAELIELYAERPQFLRFEKINTDELRRRFNK